MELNSKDAKFLTILNETRLSKGKMYGRYFEEVKRVFSFTDSELNTAVKRLVKGEMLSFIEVGGDEKVYFHTNKVSKDKLDKELLGIKH